MTMKPCIFCEIAQGSAPSHKIWEDADHIAFLSIFPNTPGVAVVIPRKHYSSYAFHLPDEVLTGLVRAARSVGLLIDRRLAGVGRTGMIFEGFGVDHVHAKLYPMHGTGDMGQWKPIHSTHRKFSTQYEGYISSHDGTRMSDDELARIANMIRSTEPPPEPYGSPVAGSPSGQV